jgi:murein DD-endopeptidase MepM/ murein hydrolase activator NlpD
VLRNFKKGVIHGDVRFAVIVGLIGLAAIVEAGCVTVQKPQIVLPANAPKIRSDYGDIWGIGGVRGTPHLGIDFLEGIGTPVLAAADGVVVRSDYRHVGGFVVILDHGKDTDGGYLGTIYAHNSENLVSVSQALF